MSKPVHIVGAGLFGQVIAARLREEDHNVTVWDRRESEAGSPPSGGHLKPSWLTAIPKPDLEHSLDTLDRLYGVETLKCKFLFKDVEIMRVDVDSVLNDGDVQEAHVTSVDNGVLTVDRKYIFEGTVIVAAGVWSAELLPQFKYHITAKKGMSFTFDGVLNGTCDNRIIPWAPYKQIVRTEHGSGKIWMGDGSAIKPENWSEEREQQIKQRIQAHVPAGATNCTVKRGLRPYMANGLRQVDTHLWLATGGGKSGMALAGVYANKLAEELR